MSEPCDCEVAQPFHGHHPSPNHIIFDSDNCGSLMMGLPAATFCPPNSVKHTAARRITTKYIAAHGSSLFKTLSWLPITIKKKSQTHSLTLRIKFQQGSAWPDPIHLSNLFFQAHFYFRTFALSASPACTSFPRTSHGFPLPALRFSS